MRNVSFTLSFILFMFCLSVQASAERDSSICITSSRLYRMGESLVVSIQLDITRNLSANESVVLVPQLSDSLDNFVQFPSIYLNGRKQHIFFQREIGRREADSEELRRRNNTLQEIRYLRSVPFSPWMRHATLSLIEKECGCGVPRSEDSTYLTRLNMLPDIRPHVAFIAPHVEEVKLREESGRAFLDFPLNETTIYPEYRNNPAELAKIKHSIDLIKNDTNVVISRIDIHGYASPEGPYANNERLARERTRTLKDYVCSQYTFNDTLFTTRHTAEDWEGFTRLLADTAMTHREELLQIATGKGSPDQKERKMRKRYPREFSFMLEHWLPALRHSDYTIHYVVRPFTVEQAKQVFGSNPKNLSIEEMFRIAQTYRPGTPEYNKVFMTAVLFNPEHPVANLNAACILLSQGNAKDAAPYLEKAGESPEKTLLLGITRMLEGDYTEAENLLRRAEEAGLPQAGENLKLLHEIF